MVSASQKVYGHRCTAGVSISLCPAQVARTSANDIILFGRCAAGAVLIRQNQAHGHFDLKSCVTHANSYYEETKFMLFGITNNHSMATSKTSI
jgi:hypothetical protein